MRCLICQSTDVHPYYDNDQRILKCASCGVGFLSEDLFNRPDTYYEKGENYIRTLHDTFRLAHIRSNAQDILRIISQTLNPPGKRLLDVGAHTGLFVQEANKRGFQAEGLEPNHTVAAWAREQGINVHSGGIYDFKSEHLFDVITLFHVLEHLKNPIEALSIIQTLLKPGGIFALEVPNADSYPACKNGLSWKFIALEHVFYFSESSLIRILKDRGFSILLVKRRNHELYQLNIKKLLHYFYGKVSKRDRFQEKTSGGEGKQIPQAKGIVKSLVQKMLIFFIHILGREDHIFIIAKKN